MTKKTTTISKTTTTTKTHNTTTTGTTSTGECLECSNSDFTLSETTCYFVSTDTATWSAAVSACQALSAALATIESEEVDNAITDDMADDSWIGLNDQAAAKVWEWTEDSTVLGSYSNWYGSNPGTVATHTCVIKKNQQSGGWDDVGCNKDLPYACTMDPVSCGTTTTTTTIATTSTKTYTTTTFDSTSNMASSSAFAQIADETETTTPTTTTTTTTNTATTTTTITSCLYSYNKLGGCCN
jgi:hypothetical protein